MLRTRVIPCLLLRNESLVKTVRFDKFGYIGDPANTCRIFNELEVDELTFLDISASKQGGAPNYRVLSDIANECFMPVSYGGGISSVAIAERVLKLGFEKVVLNTHSLNNPTLITEVSGAFGSQSVIVSIDVKTTFWGRQNCRGRSGSVDSKRHPVDWAKEVQQRGAGEILLTSIDREGTWGGFDIELIRHVTDAVSIPVIAHGGAGSLQHIGEAIKIGHASAVALGSMVVYQKQGMGVLVNFPDEKHLKAAIE
ncbi:MAG: AglZ/HisF2 family acetamidino modification protein [Syntrophales bacterium LBB04]|nr:AglZ/HisF2 family acetamidino modification protein [Syntrophales bacterium LBB04]